MLPGTLTRPSIKHPWVGGQESPHRCTQRGLMEARGGQTDAGMRGPRCSHGP